MQRIVRKKQRRAGGNRAKSAFQNECQYALTNGAGFYDRTNHPALQDLKKARRRRDGCGLPGRRYQAQTRRRHQVSAPPDCRQRGGTPTVQNRGAGDGIAETLIFKLSQLPDLKVRSLNSVLQYRGTSPDLRKVGGDLDVRAVLTGRVVVRRDNLAIVVELVDTQDNSTIWGDTYTRTLADLITFRMRSATTS